MMAAGNTYGLLLIILLMGSGLVNLPRRLWQMSDYSAEQTKYYLLGRQSINAIVRYLHYFTILWLPL
jgi:hypothetical protein